jgi:hypothetical protein
MKLSGARNGAAIQICGSVEPELEEIFSAPQHCFNYSIFSHKWNTKVGRQSSRKKVRFIKIGLTGSKLKIIRKSNLAIQYLRSSFCQTSIAVGSLLATQVQTADVSVTSLPH